MSQRSVAQADGATGAAEPLAVLLEAIPPFSFQDGEGKPVGYSVELMQALVRRCELTATLAFNSWASIYQRVQTQPRVLVVNMVRLAERESLVYWIGPTAARRTFLYRLRSRPELRLANVEAAKAYKTAVIREDAAERDLLARGFELGRHLDRSPDYSAVLRKLFARRVDLVAMNSTVAADAFRRFGYDSTKVQPIISLSDSPLYMGLSRSSGEALYDQLRRAWASMRQDGTVASIAAHFPGVSPD